MKIIMIALLAVAIALPCLDICYAKGTKVAGGKEMKVKQVPDAAAMDKVVEQRINVKEQKELPAYQKNGNPFYGDRRSYPTDSVVENVRMKNPVRGD